MKKIFIGTLLFLLIVFTPRIWAAESTEEYRNSDAGIALEYPLVWKKVEGALGATVVLLTPREEASDVFQENVNVVIQDLSASHMNLEEYTQLSEKQIKALLPEGTILSIEDSALSGLPSKIMVYTSKQAQLRLKYLGIWTIKNSKAYLVTYTAEEDKFDKFLIQAKAIIGSFKIN